VVYGRDDRFINLLARISRLSPIMPILGTGSHRLQPVSVSQVARAFVRALTQPASIGQTYDLCGNEVFRLAELIELVLRVTGRRRLRLHLPLGLARFQAGLMERACALLHRPSPLTRDQLLMLEEDNVGNPASANQDFGLVSSPLADEISRYLK